jgi:hypothetical protein
MREGKAQSNISKTEKAALWFRINRIRKFSGLSDPFIIKKKSKKNINFYCFVTSLGFFYLRTDVNVPSKSNKQKS